MYSTEERAFAAEVLDFVRETLAPETRAKVIDGRAVTKDERIAWHSALYRRGWAAPHWPVEYGGTGWSAAQTYLFAETLAEEGAPDLSSFGLRMLAPTLMRYGTEAQKALYLPRILSGEDQWCQGFSEPDAGSDLASLRTRAERIGDHWLVNGQKMWTTLAHEANMMFALVRTDPQAPKPQMGISMLLIDMKSPGIDVRPILLLNGRRTTNEVFFDNVKVPAENIVGEPNRGWDYSRVVLGNERLSIARVGLCKRQLRLLKAIAAGELVGAVRLIDTPSFRAKIAAAEIELMTVDALSLRLLGQARKGEAPGFEANMLKIKGSELQQRLTELLAEAVGPYAMPFEPDPDAAPIGPDYAGPRFKSHFDTRVVTIYGGSNEIQRNVIARGMLGLKSERRA
jgi:alkylation response protein AidB-like acyl-CoA dehydrogenase